MLGCYQYPPCWETLQILHFILVLSIHLLIAILLSCPYNSLVDSFLQSSDQRWISFSLLVNHYFHMKWNVVAKKVPAVANMAKHQRALNFNFLVFLFPSWCFPDCVVHSFLAIKDHSLRYFNSHLDISSHNCVVPLFDFRSMSPVPNVPCPFGFFFFCNLSQSVLSSRN